MDCARGTVISLINSCVFYSHLSESLFTSEFLSVSTLSVVLYPLFFPTSLLSVVYSDTESLHTPTTDVFGLHPPVSVSLSLSCLPRCLRPSPTVATLPLYLPPLRPYHPFYSVKTSFPFSF